MWNDLANLHFWNISLLIQFNQYTQFLYSNIRWLICCLDFSPFAYYKVKKRFGENRMFILIFRFFHSFYLGSCSFYASHRTSWMDSTCRHMFFWVNRQRSTGVLFPSWRTPIGLNIKCAQYHRRKHFIRWSCVTNLRSLVNNFLLSLVNNCNCNYLSTIEPLNLVMAVKYWTGTIRRLVRWVTWMRWCTFKTRNGQKKFHVWIDPTIISIMC